MASTSWKNSIMPGMMLVVSDRAADYTDDTPLGRSGHAAPTDNRMYANIRINSDNNVFHAMTAYSALSHV